MRLQSALHRAIAVVAVLFLGLVSACSPALDWREVRPEGSGLVMLLPCKPSADARMVTLAGTRVRMVLVSCRAGDANWALAYADVADPARVPAALDALSAAVLANVAGTAQPAAPPQVEGMTPNPKAQRLQVAGRMPGGEAVTIEAAFFSKGTRVFQATAMGKSMDAAAMANFFESLKLVS